MSFPRFPKKIQTLFLIIILSIGIVIGGFLVLKSRIIRSENNSTIIGQANQDTDNDGLLDWEEEIYKTGPNNPDTDKDGYLDGEEVASGYDPTKPAPNDKSSDKAIEPRPAPGVLSKDANFTRILLNNIVAT